MFDTLGYLQSIHGIGVYVLMININRTLGVIDIDSPLAKIFRSLGKGALWIGVLALVFLTIGPGLRWQAIVVVSVLFFIPGWLLLRYKLHVLITKEKLLERKIRFSKEKRIEIRFDDVNRICLMFRIATASSAGNRSSFMVYPMLVLNSQGIARYGDDYYSLLGNFSLDEFANRKEFF
mgnify:CR=1 FL=1